MKNPWMPLYIADYIADTAHLSAAQHGAYLLLMMHYWRQGSLPKDDEAIARIARMSRHEWAHARKVIATFFDAEWKHKRIDIELNRCAKIASKRREVGARGGRAKSLKDKEWALANATDLPPDLPRSCPSKNVDSSQTLPNGRVHSIPLPNGKGLEVPILEVQIETAEFKLYRRGKEILGPSSGGQIKRLRAAVGGDVALARAALETASTKHDPAEYIGGVIRSRNRESYGGAADDLIT